MLNDAEQLEVVVERLVASTSVASVARDDLRQELWLRLLEGATERDLRRELPRLKSEVHRQELGAIAEISLDTPVGVEEWQTIADGLSTDGKYFGRPIWQRPAARSEQRAERKRRIEQRREQWRLQSRRREARRPVEERRARWRDRAFRQRTQRPDWIPPPILCVDCMGVIGHTKQGRAIRCPKCRLQRQADRLARLNSQRRMRSHRVRPIRECQRCHASFENPYCGKRQYCSDECKRQAKQASRRLSPLQVKVCGICERRFYSRAAQAKYCSAACITVQTRIYMRNRYRRSVGLPPSHEVYVRPVWAERKADAQRAA